MLTNWIDTSKIPFYLSRLALAALWVCISSGFVLVFQYFPFGNVFKNVQEISNDYPYGFFFRGAHYWSAQVFIVLTLLHIADHFLRRSYARAAATRWVFLTLSTVIVFFYPLPVLYLKGTRKEFLQGISLRIWFETFQYLVRSLPSFFLDPGIIFSFCLIYIIFSFSLPFCSLYCSVSAAGNHV